MMKSERANAPPSCSLARRDPAASDASSAAEAWSPTEAAAEAAQAAAAVALRAFLDTETREEADIPDRVASGETSLSSERRGRSSSEERSRACAREVTA